MGTALALGGIGPITGNSIFIPALIIGVIYVPYLGKPIRGEVLRLREMDCVDAARVQGMGSWRVMLSEILPNATSTIIVFVPMMLATSILLEAYLSFLGAGVQPPNASWGTLISDGINYLDTTPTFALIPGAMLVLTVLSINIGFLISGTVVIENVFQVPGLGSLLVQSVLTRDYPVIQALVFVFGVLVIATNLLADVAYWVADPRIRFRRVA